MTIVFLQPDGVPITAQAERQGSAALYGGGSGRPLGGRSGFRIGTPSDTLAATSTTWTLKPCSAMIDPGAATHQGMYGWATDSNITGTVAASDATYARKDIVFIQINDSSAGDGSGALSADPAYLAGTPSATPTAPTLPARSFLVGTIDVPKTGAGSPTVTLNPARFAAAGGALPVWSQAQRDALVPFDGLEVKRMDYPNRPNETHNGTGYRLGPQGHIQYSARRTLAQMTNTLARLHEVTAPVLPGRVIRVTLRLNGKASADALYADMTFLADGVAFEAMTINFDKLNLGQHWELSGIFTSTVATSVLFSVNAQIAIPAAGATVSMEATVSGPSNMTLHVEDIGPA